MRRFLLLAVITAAAIVLLLRLARILARRPSADDGARGRGPERGTELVRDRICNTFLPRDRALSLKDSGQTHYFCSEECRSRYLAGGAGGGGAALMAS